MPFFISTLTISTLQFSFLQGYFFIWFFISCNSYDCLFLQNWELICWGGACRSSHNSIHINNICGQRKPSCIIYWLTELESPKASQTVTEAKRKKKTLKSYMIESKSNGNWYSNINLRDTSFKYNWNLRPLLKESPLNFLFIPRETLT